MSRTIGYTGILLLMIFFMIGCAGWRPVREVETVEAPQQFVEASDFGEYMNDPWWELFDDPVLNDLMVEAFANNLTLQGAAARMDQARALLSISRASWFPGIAASGSYSESDVLEEETAPAGAQGGMLAGPSTGSTWTVGLSATYELDIWGELKAGREASYANLMASENSLRALMISISAQIARSYFTMIELKEQVALLDRTITSYEANLELLTERYRRGVTQSVDVYQAETNLAGARAQRAMIQSNLIAVTHALNVLLGRYPGDELAIDIHEFPVDVEFAPPGLPSELVLRRPDVRMYYGYMVAADRQAAEAQAQRLPSITLTGSLGGSSEELNDAVDPTNMIWSVGGNIVMPLFQGGALRGNANRAEAAWREAVTSYQSRVLTAYQEVETALATGRLQLEYMERLEEQVAAAQATLRLTTDHYLQGVTDFLPVVTSQTMLLNAESSLLTAKRSLVESRIGLITALGGGWTDEMIEEYLVETSLHVEDATNE